MATVESLEKSPTMLVLRLRASSAFSIAAFIWSCSVKIVVQFFFVNELDLGRIMPLECFGEPSGENCKLVAS